MGLDFDVSVCAQSKVVKDLDQAHSGATLDLRLHKGQILVCKRMPATDRSWRCLKKQKEFLPLDKVSAVEVLSSNAVSGEVEVLMPLTRGVVGVEYITSLSVEEVNSFSSALSSLLLRSQNEAIHSSSQHHLITAKIEELRANHTVPKSYRLLLKHLDLKIKTIPSFRIGTCHGDLTLGNMIFEKDTGRLQLIDFLDTYIESPLIDLAKLEQDLVFGWSSRYENPEVRLRAKIFGAHVFDTIKILDAQDEKLFNIIRVLNTLRILPYCKDSTTEEWVRFVVTQQEQIL